MFDHLGKMLLQLTLNALLLLLLTLFDGMWFDKTLWVLGSSVVFAVLNTFLPLLILVCGFHLSVPTLAVNSLVANAATLLFLEIILPSFHIVGFWTTLTIVAIVAVANFVMNWFFHRKVIKYGASLR